MVLGFTVITFPIASIVTFFIAITFAITFAIVTFVVTFIVTSASVATTTFTGEERPYFHCRATRTEAMLDDKESEAERTGGMPCDACGAAGGPAAAGDSPCAQIGLSQSASRGQ